MGKKDRNVKDIENDVKKDLARETQEYMDTQLPKGKILVSGADFWNFEESPEFIGTPLGSMVKDPNDGRVLGFDFADDNGEQWIIGASHSIEKALDMDIEGKKVIDLGRKLLIQWKGKISLKDSGKTFNKYYVVMLD